MDWTKDSALIGGQNILGVKNYLFGGVKVLKNIEFKHLLDFNTFYATMFLEL